ncbi:MAG TPA: ketopantoate reductase family protein [Candidatus Bathyarchaeia archaeon]|nr:ketopantoate reductase family protein [Candidatus Bathyarchaeia archaeon]
MFLVMGSGSVGSLFGGMISTVYSDVRLVGRTNHIQAINNNGLKIQGLINKTVNVSGVTSVEDIHQEITSESKIIEYILITTKAHQTESAVNDLKRIVSKETIFIALQNGIGTEEIIKNIFPDNMVLRGITSIGVCRPISGEVEFTGKGLTRIGYTNQDEKNSAKVLVDLFNKAKITTSLEQNILGAVFTKTIVNCALNPLTAIYNIKNIEVYKQKPLHKKASILAKEAWNVAKKLNIKLTVKDPIAYTFEVILDTGENTNSMLTDVLNKRKTEIDFINGKIIFLGKEKGVSISNNQEIYDKVIDITKGFS